LAELLIASTIGLVAVIRSSASSSLFGALIQQTTGSPHSSQAPVSSEIVDHPSTLQAK